MQIRIGITAPLVLGGDRGALRLPEIADPNFTVVRSEAMVWIDSPAPFPNPPAGLDSTPSNGRFTVRGSAAPGTWIETPLPSTREFWTADPVAGDGVAIGQFAAERESRSTDRIVAVIDGSAHMESHARAIAAALAHLPESVQLGVVVASDAPVMLLAPGAAREPALEALRRFPFAGGQDGAPALELAFARAEGSSHAAVLWIHAPVPLELSSHWALRQRFERAPDGLRWYALQTRDGSDALLAALSDVAPLALIPRRATVGEDLSNALAEISGTTHATPELQRVRARAPGGVAVAAATSASSAHLSRLWARDEVRRLLRTGRAGAREEAAQLASRYRVITPVSGAVVLERDAQYAENRLETPASGADYSLAAGATPAPPITDDGPLAAIPEPSTGTLAALGLVAIAAWRRRHRRMGV